MARKFSKSFYNSKEWRLTREYILKRDNYLCLHCGAPAQEVHHVIHLSPKNITDVTVSLNPNNLVSLCRDCHFKEHYGDKGEGHRTKPKDTEIDKEVYEFDENGYLIKRISPLSN